MGHNVSHETLDNMLDSVQSEAPPHVICAFRKVEKPFFMKFEGYDQDLADARLASFLVFDSTTDQEADAAEQPHEAESDMEQQILVLQVANRELERVREADCEQHQHLADELASRAATLRERASELEEQARQRLVLCAALDQARLGVLTARGELVEALRSRSFAVLPGLEQAVHLAEDSVRALQIELEAMDRQAEHASAHVDSSPALHSGRSTTGASHQAPPMHYPALAQSFVLPSGGRLHHSGIGIYVQAVAALELAAGMTFLNIGSGTGYLSMVVGTLLGPDGVNHGVELAPDVTEFARSRTRALLRSPAFDFGRTAPPFFLNGQALWLESERPYDRIYVGAACTGAALAFFCSLLAIGGKLVAPTESDVICVTRSSAHVFSTTVAIPGTAFSNLVIPAADVQVVPLRFPPHAWRNATAPSLAELCRSALERLHSPDAGPLSPQVIAQLNLTPDLATMLNYNVPLTRARCCFSDGCVRLDATSGVAAAGGPPAFWASPCPHCSGRACTAEHLARHLACAHGQVDEAARSGSATSSDQDDVAY